MSSITFNTARPLDRRFKLNPWLLFVLGLALLYTTLVGYSGSAFPLRLIDGTSMEPTLSRGDIVILQQRSFDAIRVGDVVAFKTPEALSNRGLPGSFLHRVIRKDFESGQPVLITKGDNAAADPFPVPPSAVVGVQTISVPALGLPAVFVTSRQGILFVSIATLLALLYIPAMAVYYSVVLKRPAGGASGSGPMESTLGRITSEQREMRNSLSQLSESIAYYATHIKSHTAVVENLAKVTERLRSAVDTGGKGSGRKDNTPR